MRAIVVNKTRIKFNRIPYGGQSRGKQVYYSIDSSSCVIVALHACVTEIFNSSPVFTGIIIVQRMFDRSETQGIVGHLISN